MTADTEGGRSGPLNAGIKVVIAVPFSGRFVPPEWAIALATLQFPMNCSIAHMAIKGRKRDEARTFLVEQSLSLGAEYILFLDDDTAPPPDTISQLMKELDSTGDDVVVCGGIYTDKRDSPSPMVFKDHLGGPFWRWKYGDVFPCHSLGTGCMMIRLSVFKQLEKPWFRDITTLAEAIGDPVALPNGPEPGVTTFRMTDDIYFQTKLANTGFKVLAHGGVLPIHYDQAGKPHVLAYSDPPLRDTDPTAIWYSRQIPRPKRSSSSPEESPAIPL